MNDTLEQLVEQQAERVAARARLGREGQPVAYDLVVLLAGGTRRTVTRTGSEERAREQARRTPGALVVESCVPVSAREFRQRFLVRSGEGGGS